MAHHTCLQLDVRGVEIQMALLEYFSFSGRSVAAGCRGTDDVEQLLERL